ncbi:MAG: metallophosphoesterase [Polyangiaceae bacterium]
MIAWRKGIGAVAVVATTSMACTGVTRERTEEEAAIGSTSAPGIAIRVADGLAALRDGTLDRIHLRAGAPAIDVHVELANAPETFHFEIDNVLPDARCTAIAGDGTSLFVKAEARGRSLDKTCDVSIPRELGPAVTLDLHVASDDDGSAEPFTFGLLADVQEAVGEVDAIYARMGEEADLRFVLFSGDLTRGGSREELLEFERHEKRLDVPLYATLGNHELGSDRVHFHDLYGRGNYSFVYRSTRFTLLDSASATIDPAIYDRLDAWLGAGRHGVHVVAMHVPPFDPSGFRNGAFASRSEAAKLLERLAEGRVDLTLYGHVHSYYAFANAGIPAYISGGGGAIPERLDGIGRHYMKFHVDPIRGVRDATVVRVD